MEIKTWKEKIASSSREIKPRVNALSAKANSSLRENPAKWAGIATGAGLGVGLLARFLSHRSRQRSHDRVVPAIVIIEAAR